MSDDVIERMSRVDTAWLRMDSPANPMGIVGVWLIAPRLSLADLRERVAGSLLAYRRFRQKVAEDPAGALWVDDVRFDLGRHVLRETLPHRRGDAAPAALEALKRRVAELAAAPLPRDRPLWEFRLVEDLDGRRSALIARVHHCIGDGIALISVMLSLADGGWPPSGDRAHVGDVAPAAGGDPLEALVRGVAAAAPLAAQALQDAAALALMPDDTPTRLKGQATPGKRVAWGEPLSLDSVKAVGRVFGVSVNDVLLAAVAGAIGDYLRSKGDDTTGCELRAMVPVNLRPPGQAWQLGNRFGLAPLLLPVGVVPPVERLYAVHSRMAALKGSLQPLLAFGVLALAGLVVKPVQDAITGLFARKATAVMTNVPGPAQPLKLCGRTVEQVMFWVPQTGDIGLGVSVLSYAGGVQFGLVADAKLCPDPQDIVSRFAPQFEQLLWLALMSPWPVME
jgi:WS/DGAT/MGAT family acyltransferase